MKNLVRSQFAHYLVWACGLVTLLVLKPQPGSTPFIFIVVVVFALGISLMWRSHLETRAEQLAFSLWQERFQSVAPLVDVDDDGHLYEWLDLPQWEAVFLELEESPSGERSLLKAIKKVAPEALP